MLCAFPPLCARHRRGLYHRDMTCIPPAAPHRWRDPIVGPNRIGNNRGRADHPKVSVAQEDGPADGELSPKASPTTDGFAVAHANGAAARRIDVLKMMRSSMSGPPGLSEFRSERNDGHWTALRVLQAHCHGSD